mgnify:CR=1 FL=1
MGQFRLFAVLLCEKDVIDVIFSGSEIILNGWFMVFVLLIKALIDWGIVYE